ncbi:glycosyl transferase, group 1 family protein, putative [Heliomicrobium modesticaldum Ice1]|uniref:Glycosyl transferase, group 1 family protein, putative n=1 Tax=Heliobacterium modesticaldum (strain ATCC 51547 / Ice1) TaxID=498761 RepID=B0THF4_HELMI|nr:glycosyltransferase [Heliomicrobium modesticaldum]ABZ83392.1 glycosyl transferase, group 1 family protein, putative [Heliomicrobium modesticaldum Ice1]
MTVVDIVCIGAAEWRGIWARAQQLMVRLAQRGHRILYVDPPITYLAPLKNRDLLQRRWQSAGRLEEVEPGRIWRLEPPIFLPFHGMRRSLNSMNQRRLGRSLRRRLGQLGWEQPLLWTYLPGSCDLLSAGIDWRYVVYDCVDDHAAFTGLIDPAVMADMESDLARRADAVFASARALQEKMRRFRPDVLLVPNAADVEHFAQAAGTAGDAAGLETTEGRKDSEDIGGVKDLKNGAGDLKNADYHREQKPADLPSGYRHIIGFIGGIGDWIDTALLAAAARAHKDWALALIGPVETDVTALQALPNVFFLGRKPYAVLPDYVRCFDVCLSPFRLNELTMSVNPVKVYEYLAAGKPVISTALPEVLPFSPIVTVCEGAEAFVASIETAFAEDSPEKQAERMALARQHSWDARLTAMLDKIGEGWGCV